MPHVVLENINSVREALDSILPFTTKIDVKWLHYPGHTKRGIMPDNGGVSYEFPLFNRV